jgi:nickel/cobalt transporter (NiCoT) family protein
LDDAEEGLNRLCGLFGDGAQGWRGKAASMCALLLATNVAVWIWAVIAFSEHPVLLGTAMLAYGFGLRHAVDADHVAAIDNVVRKLIQEGRHPIGVGLFFSLGHSTVVVGLCVAIAFATNLLQGSFVPVKAIGEAVGAGVSACFLFAIAFANLVVLKGIYGAFRRARSGEKLIEQDLEMLLASRGLVARLCRGLFRLIGRSWHMYPLGLLFGLGFDPATEVGLLGISATSAAKGLPVWSVLVFPALFAAGMTLGDTTDNLLMLGAYGWAFVKPIRKLYYNMTITLVSVIVAVLIGGIEALRLIGDQLGLSGWFWDGIGMLNDNFNSLGFIIIGVFIVAWIGSVLYYRYAGLDELEIAPTQS